MNKKKIAECVFALTFIISFVCIILVVLPLKKVAAQAASCQSEGNKEYYINIFGVCFEDENGTKPHDKSVFIIEKTKHQLTPVQAKEATCTEDGNTEYWSCATCNNYFDDEQGKIIITDKASVVIETKHKLILVTEKEATCTEEGQIASWQCSSCGKIFLDEHGNIEMDRDSLVGEKAKGHNYNAVSNHGEWLWATDYSAANFKYICTVCNELQEVQASISVNEIAPTCEEIGYKIYKATVIIGDLNYSDEKTIEIPVIGHTTIIDIAVSPDCTHTGLTEGSHCSVCGATIIVQHIVEKSEHDYSYVTTVPTFTEQGYTNFTCKNCGFSYVGEFVDALLSFSLSEEDGYSYIVSGCNIANKMPVIIPETYDNLPVTSIGKNAFLNNIFVTNITLSKNIASIEASAFSGCSSLISANLSEDLISIGNSAFSACSSLKNIYIPESVKTIGSSAFSKCTKLTNIEFPNSVDKIGSAALSGCSSLVSVTLPFVGGSIKSASDTYQYPFGYIFGTSSYIGGTAISQTYYTYAPGSGTYSSSTYYIPNSLERVTILGGNILSGAFYNCNVKKIIVPNNIKTIEKYAFYSCSALRDFIIPKSVERIEYMAFDGCRALKSIVIPDNVIYLGESAFSKCSALENVIISKNLTNLEHVFSSCTSLKSVEIPDKVTSIKGAFFQCSALESIFLPKSIKTMENAFANIYNSEIDRKVYYKGTLADWCALQFNSVADTPLIYQGHFYLINSLGVYEEITNLIIPSAISNIGDYQFYGFSFLNSVTIPKTVKAIGNNAFCQCVGLTDIVITENVSTIGDKAFYQCSSLAKIEIGAGVKSIGKTAFVGCYVWAEVTFKQTNGWWVSKDLTATSGTYISSSQLENSTQAHTFLSASNYYADYYWKRS